MHIWREPGLFGAGFQPFYLFGAGCAGMAMVVWLLSMSGALVLPTQFDPVLWHALGF